MRGIILLTSMISVVFATSTTSAEWKAFKELYHKTYEGEEDRRHMSIFEVNKRKVEDSNKLYKEGLITYTSKLNAFSDLSLNEFRELMLFSPSKNRKVSSRPQGL